MATLGLAVIIGAIIGPELVGNCREDRTLTSFGGTCVVANMCPAKFVCVGCAGNAPDPAKRYQIDQKQAWAEQQLQYARREKLVAEERQMKQLIADCKLIKEEMDLIEAMRKDAAQTVSIEHGPARYGDASLLAAAAMGAPEARHRYAGGSSCQRTAEGPCRGNVREYLQACEHPVWSFDLPNTIKRNELAYRIYLANRRPPKRKQLRESLLMQLFDSAPDHEKRSMWSKTARLRRESKDSLIARLISLERTVKQQKNAENLLREEILRLVRAGSR